MDWFAGGVSIRGSRHEVNQDAVGFHCEGDTWILTVSDGLGSKSRSQIGSKALCTAAWTQLCLSAPEEIFRDPVEFLRQVHGEWLCELRDEAVCECYATALILLATPGKALAMQLGDGFIAVLADGGAHVLLDDKSEHYINETDCLQEVFTPELVRYELIEYETFHGGLLCSDGVEIGDMSKETIAGFTENFCEGCSGLLPGKAEYQVRKWLSGWPGSDDKTAAYLLNKGAAQ